jgi:predicted ester cyclase
MTRITARGTFLGECIGYQPNGNVVEISGIAVHRIEGGRLMEHWAQADMAGFMRQIVAEATPAVEPAPSTSAG